MEELHGSELGTQEYWEKCYQDEMKYFKKRGDPGEMWFGEDSANRIVKWMNKSQIVNKDAKIVDVGCGNGMLLIELANNGYTSLSGIDYSGNAIKLAHAVAQKQNLEIKYTVCDILEGFSENYEVILDKGTYDAVSLSNEAKKTRNKYIQSVHNCLSADGIFIITSCNWTLSELDEHFADKFKLLETIPTPQFKFGGSVGNVVTSCVYKKL